MPANVSNCCIGRMGQEKRKNRSREKEGLIIHDVSWEAGGVGSHLRSCLFVWGRKMQVWDHGPTAEKDAYPPSASSSKFDFKIKGWRMGYAVSSWGFRASWLGVRGTNPSWVSFCSVIATEKMNPWVLSMCPPSVSPLKGTFQGRGRQRVDFSARLFWLYIGINTVVLWWYWRRGWTTMQRTYFFVYTSAGITWDDADESALKIRNYSFDLYITARIKCETDRRNHVIEWYIHAGIQN